MNFLLAGALSFAGYQFTKLDNLPPKKKKKPRVVTHDKPSSVNIYDSNLVNSINDDYNVEKLRRHMRGYKPSITGIIPDSYNTRLKDDYGDVKIFNNTENKVINGIIGRDKQISFETKKNDEVPFSIRSLNEYKTGQGYTPELTYERTIEGFENKSSQKNRQPPKKGASETVEAFDPNIFSVRSPEYATTGNSQARGLSGADMQGEGGFADFNQPKDIKNEGRRSSLVPQQKKNGKKTRGDNDQLEGRESAHLGFEPFSNEYQDRMLATPTSQPGLNSTLPKPPRRSPRQNPESKEFDPMNFLDHEREYRNSKAQRKLLYDGNRYEGNWSDMFDDVKFDNPTDPVAGNAIPANTCNRKRIDMERELSAKDSWTPYNRRRNMTYNVTPDENFVHNNMVPFYKTKKSYGGNDKGLDDYKNQKLELFTGSSQYKQLFPKKESGPRFAPQMNVSNIYGAPNADYQLDRFNMILSDTKNGELAFDPVRVNSGLNLDYYEQGNEGYHPIFRPLPKTTNEMRNADKPKIENGNMINHGQRGTKRAVQADVNKNKPFTYYEQGPEDLMKSYGYVTAPKLRENYMLDPTKRSYSSVAYVTHPGSAYGDVGKTGPEYMYPKHRVTDKVTYGNAGLRNVQRNTEGQYVGNYYAIDTQRADTTHAERAGHMSATNPTSYFIDPKDVPRATTKETTLFDTGGYTNVTGNSRAGTVPWNQQMKTTTKEQFENTQYSGNMGYNTYKGKSFDPKDVTKTTMAEMTMFDTGNYNKVSGLVSKQRAFDPNDALKTTMKELTEQEIRAGNMHRSGGYTNPAPLQDQMRTTRKQLHQNKDRGGQVGNTQNQRGGYESATYRAPTTMKEIYSDAIQAGQVSNTQNQRGGYESATYRAPTTMKEIYSNAIQGGNISGGNVQNGQQKGNYNAKTTLRQIVENSVQGGNVSNTQNQHGGYESATYRAPTTLRQIIENSTQGGNVGNTQNQKGGYQSAIYRAPTTLRQIIENSTQGGNVGNTQNQHGGYESATYRAGVTNRQIFENSVQGGNMSGSNVQNKMQVGTYRAPTTLRQIVENSTQAGYMGREGFDKGGYLAEKPYAKPTIKQTTSAVYKVGGGNGNFGVGSSQAGTYYLAPTTKQSTQNVYYTKAPLSNVQNHQVYDPFYNMEIDDRKQTLAMNGRAPTTSNYEKVKSDPFTGYRLKALDNYARPQHGMEYNPMQQAVVGCMTKNPSFVQENTRFDVFTNHALKSNPYNLEVFGINSENMASNPYNNTKTYTGYYNPYSQNNQM